MYSHKTLYLKTFDISWCILNVMFEFCVETKKLDPQETIFRDAISQNAKPCIEIH